MTGVVLRSGTRVDLTSFGTDTPSYFPVEDLWWGMAHAFARRDAPLTVAQRAWLSEKCVDERDDDSVRRAVVLRYAHVAFGYPLTLGCLSFEARQEVFDLQDHLEQRFSAVRSVASERAAERGESLESRILNLSPGDSEEPSQWFPATVLVQPVFDPRSAFVMLSRRARVLGF